MADEERIREALNRFARNSKLLVLLDESGRERLATCARTEQRRAGDVVVRQGEQGSTFYLVATGTLRVSVVDGAGAAPREVAVLTAGSFFGEIGVLTRQPRSATVSAVTSCELLCFDRDPVMVILAAYPSVREVIGSVGLHRSQANLESRASVVRASGGESPGLSELLEGEDELVVDGRDDRDDEEGKT